MAILWCGGEDIDFPTFTGCVMSTAAAHFRSGYSRGSVAATSSSAAKSTLFPGGAITSFWFSVRIYNNNSGTAMRIVGLGDSATAKTGLYIGTSAASNTRIAVHKYDGATHTQLGAEAGNSFTVAAMHKIDMQVINYGANAEINIYVNGSLVLELPDVNCAIAGTTDLDSVFISNLNAGVVQNLTEIIVANTDTRNLSLITHIPNAAGDTLDWTGAYTALDEVTIDDADLAYDNTDGHQAMYNLSATPAGSFSVVAVKESVRACVSADATPTSLDIGIKSGASVDVADNHSLTTAWATYERYMTVNPITSGAFTTAEMDALQIVLESEA